ncbi:hypothetical protein, partial [Microcoleus anatoxicus]
MSSQSRVHKTGRAAKAGVKLVQKTGGNLVLASGVTITLLLGMVLALSLAAVFIKIHTGCGKLSGFSPERKATRGTSVPVSFLVSRMMWIFY